MPPPQVKSTGEEEASTCTTAAAVSSQLVSMPSMRRSRRAWVARATVEDDATVEGGRMAGDGVAGEEDETEATKWRRVEGRDFAGPRRRRRNAAAARETAGDKVGRRVAAIPSGSAPDLRWWTRPRWDFWI